MNNPTIGSIVYFDDCSEGAVYGITEDRSGIYTVTAVDTEKRTCTLTNDKRVVDGADYYFCNEPYKRLYLLDTFTKDMFDDLERSGVSDVLFCVKGDDRIVSFSWTDKGAEGDYVYYKGSVHFFTTKPYMSFGSIRFNSNTVIEVLRERIAELFGRSEAK